jgi:hypothetical protein
MLAAAAVVRAACNHAHLLSTAAAAGAVPAAAEHLPAQQLKERHACSSTITQALQCRTTSKVDCA